MCKHCHDAHADAHSHIHNGDCEHTHAHSHESGHEHGHEHGSCGADAAGWRELIPAAISLAGLVFGLCIDHFVGWGSLAALRPLYYFLAFLPVGLPVLREAWEELRGGDVWNEFLLMGVACICAFLIGEFPEAIGVMLFYSVGEWLQDRSRGVALIATLRRSSICGPTSPASCLARKLQRKSRKTFKWAM